MEDIKNTQKLNNVPVDPPEVKRTVTGEIDLEAIATGKDDKGYIIPDNIFDYYLKELPEGTTNQSGTFRAYNGGKLTRLENNREEASRRGYNGSISSNNSQAARRTNKEIIDILLTRKAPKEAIERLGLAEDATMIEAANLAQLIEAMKGNTKAMEYIRDTAGEKPTEKIDASLSAMTPEQQKILEDIKAFNSNT